MTLVPECDEHELPNLHDGHLSQGGHSEVQDTLRLRHSQVRAHHIQYTVTLVRIKSEHPYWTYTTRPTQPS
jgi:hypothetical protein